MSKLDRRTFAISSVAVSLAAVGCNSNQALEVADDLTDSVSTENLEAARISLRGYEIVTLFIGPRVVTLPVPGARILTVLVIASGLAAKLVVSYLDEKLTVRKVTEALTDQERGLLESEGKVRFQTASGIDEDVFLAPTKYEEEL
ncbi:MAG: hypothetical protein AB8B91_22720 [Rubripirellula sp.]